jgi:hypothetical protein
VLSILYIREVKEYMNKKTICKTLVIGLLSILVLSSITPSASSQIKNSVKTPSMVDWSDDFELYAIDQFLDGGVEDGGWKGWDSVPEAGAYVRDYYAHGGTHSVEIEGLTDLVHEYSGYTAGVWNYTAWQYIPTDFSGDSAFILLSDYIDGAGQSNTWVVQLSFNSATGLVQSQWNNEEMDYVTGQWMEIRCEIDLTGDWLQIYYGDQLLAEHAYSDTVNSGGGGPLIIDAVDLFANSASPVYYDDISLTGESIPTVPDLDCSGTLTWTKVKSGSTVNGTFQVSNIGDVGSLLNWEVDSNPTWGTWTFTPASGTGLADGDSVTITAEVVAPAQKKKTFTGTIKLVNSDDPTDFCEIEVSLTTPRTSASSLILRILEKFPNAFPILRQILNL